MDPGEAATDRVVRVTPLTAEGLAFRRFLLSREYAAWAEGERRRWAKTKAAEPQKEKR